MASGAEKMGVTESAYSRSTAAVAAASSAIFGSIWSVGSSIVSRSKDVAAYLPSVAAEAPKLPQPTEDGAASGRRLSIDSTHSSGSASVASSIITQSLSSLSFSVDNSVDAGAQVSLKDFGDYIAACGNNLAEKSLSSPPAPANGSSTEDPTRMLISQQNIPAVFFDEKFDLEQQETFDSVFGTGDVVQTAGLMQQRMSRHVDAIEELLAVEARKQSAESMFVALSESNSTFEAMLQALPPVDGLQERVRSLLEDFTDQSLFINALYMRRMNLLKVLSHLDRMQAVSEALGAVQMLVEQGSFDVALDALYAKDLSFDGQDDHSDMKLLFFEDATRRKDSLLDSIEAALERIVVEKTIVCVADLLYDAMSQPASALFRIQGRSRSTTIQKLKAVLSNGLRKTLKEAKDAAATQQGQSFEQVLSLFALLLGNGRAQLAKTAVVVSTFKQLIQQNRRHLTRYEQEMQTQLRSLVQDVATVLESELIGALQSSRLTELSLDEFAQFCTLLLAQIDDLNSSVQQHGVTFDVTLGQLQNLGQTWLKEFFSSATGSMERAVLADSLATLSDATSTQQVLDNALIDELSSSSSTTSTDPKYLSIKGQPFLITSGLAAFLTTVSRCIGLLNTKFARILPDLDICNRIIQLFVSFNARLSGLILGAEAVRIEPRVIDSISPKILIMTYLELLCLKTLLPVMLACFNTRSKAAANSRALTNRYSDLVADLDDHMNGIATKITSIIEDLLIVRWVERWQQQVREGVNDGSSLSTLEVEKGFRSLRVQLQRSLERHPQHQKRIFSGIAKSLQTHLDHTIDVICLGGKGDKTKQARVLADLKTIEEKFFSPNSIFLNFDIDVSMSNWKQRVQKTL